MSDSLRELQLEELEMTCHFIKICESHSLRYYIIGGTLLGAIRHKGFIPWDDDIDIAMPREDYKKLLSIMKTYDSESYYFINYDTDPNYSYAWARMNSKKFKVINHMANIPRVEPIFIDIIPLDGFPDGCLKRLVHKVVLSFWWTLNQLCQFDKMVDQKRKRSNIGKFCVSIAAKFKWVGKCVSYKKCLEMLNRTLERYPYDSNTKDVINFLAAYGFDEIFPRSAFATTVNYRFENISIAGPCDYDAICKATYGDYMTLPPEEDRNKHHIEIISEKE